MLLRPQRRHDNFHHVNYGPLKHHDNATSFNSNNHKTPHVNRHRCTTCSIYSESVHYAEVVISLPFFHEVLLRSEDSHWTPSTVVKIFRQIFQYFPPTYLLYYHHVVFVIHHHESCCFQLGVDACHDASVTYPQLRRPNHFNVR